MFRAEENGAMWYHHIRSPVLHVDLGYVLLENWPGGNVLQRLKDQMQMTKTLNIYSAGIRLALELICCLELR